MPLVRVVVSSAKFQPESAGAICGNSAAVSPRFTEVSCRQLSDQRAPGLSLFGYRGGGVLTSRGDFRAPGLSFRVNRKTEGIAEELLLMGLVANSQVVVTTS